MLRNRERMLRRSEARRRQREAQADETGASTATDLELHRQRVLSTLHEVVAELDEDDICLRPSVGAGSRVGTAPLVALTTR